MKRKSLLFLSLLLALPNFISSSNIKCSANDSYNASDLFNCSAVDFLGDTYKGTKYDYRIFGNEVGLNGFSFNFTSSSGRFSYKNVINLNNLKWTEDNKVNVVEMFANPDIDDMKLSKIRFTLTDVYDPTISFSVSYTQNGGWRLFGKHEDKGCSNSFITAEFNGYNKGISNYPAEANKVVAWDQSFYTGEAINDEGVTKQLVPTSFGFNIDENVVYVQIKKDTWVPLYDLDDKTDMIPDFKGFTTGEVYFSCDSNMQTGAAFFSKIGEDSFESINDLLFHKNTGNLLIKSKNIDNLPDALVGSAYPLPDISASNKNVNITATCNGNSVSKFNYNNFKPTKLGSYVITLSNTNDFEYPFTQSLVINATNSEDLPVEAQSEPISINVREVNCIPEFSYSGGRGDLTIEYRLYKDDEMSIVNPGDKYEITKKYSEVNLKVFVTDYINKVTTFEHPINVNYNKCYFHIDGYKEVSVAEDIDFKVPGYTAIDYSLPNCDKNNIKVVIKSGLSNIYKPGDLIFIKSDLILDYQIDGVTVDQVKVKCVPIDIVAGSKEYSIEKQYFLPSQVNRLDLNDVGESFVLNNGDATITHPFAVSTSNLAFEFALIDGNSIDAVQFKLLDLFGRELIIEIFNFNESPVLKLNGVETYAQITVTNDSYSGTNSLFMNKNYKLYKFTVKNEYRTIVNDSNKTIESLQTWSNGDKFEGFSNCCAQIIIDVKGASAGDVFTLTKLSNQYIRSSAFRTGDIIGPEIGFDKPVYDKIYKLGDVETISQSYCYDVFDYFSRAKQTITSPKYTIILDINSLSSYTFNFNEYGTFNVKYSLYDAKGASTTRSYSFMVEDSIAPSITINGLTGNKTFSESVVDDSESVYQKTYSGRVPVYYAIATDNYDSNVNVYVYLKNDGATYYVVNMGSYLDLAKGRYSLYYQASDFTGNLTYVRFNFVVE